MLPRRTREAADQHMQNGSNGGQDLPNDRRAGSRDKAQEAQESKSLKAVGEMLRDNL
jgi:hypothetical protein